MMGCARPQTPAAPKQKPHPPGEIQTVQRSRDIMPIRPGGVYLRGLGASADPQEDSAAAGTKLTADNQNWLATHCDVVALDARCIDPETFPAMRRTQRLFTPLLYLYASTLYEQPDHKGNVGGWQPAMSAWTLRDSQGNEVKHPDPGGHWMDFGSPEWAAHWKKQALAQVGRYHAFGAVAAELPLGNTFVGNDLARYKTSADRIDATEKWLTTVRASDQYLVIPSALGFDGVAGHATLPVPHRQQEEPDLVGRIWDEYAPLLDGAWAEGWVRPYWAMD